MLLCKFTSVSNPVESCRAFLVLTHLFHKRKVFSSALVRDYGTFPPAYEPHSIEEGRYETWEKNGSFKPKRRGIDSEAFSMILPPPNVTGTLHLGHALTVTLQDILCRWNRMQGHPVVWVPGFDHAGIATQVVVEKKLKNERNLSRHDLGREKFIQEVMSWKEEKILVIRNQLKKLGASLDWSQETFTMDEKQSMAVREAIIRLFEGGYLYRDEMLVNWSCFLQSAISDIEVEHKEISGPTSFIIPGYEEPVTFGYLHDFAYRFVDQEGEVIVSTTRIETMFGDVAVAVHPSDERYQNLEGTMLYHPFRKCSIPLIYDHSVVPDFGTGAVKITPAHSHTDFQVAKQHKLPLLSIINAEGLLTDKCGEFSGLKRYDARTKVIEALEKQGLLRGSKPHSHSIPCCSRSGDIVELLLQPQWFLNLDGIAKKIIVALNKNEISIEPASYKKVLQNWFRDDLRHWCISRQIWWGHRLPLYFAKDTWVAAHSNEEAKQKFKKKLNLTDEESKNLEIHQDEDVLDTWFSSALLPFSAFGWPSKTEDLKQFYPLSLMETGNDIVNFWVARMLSLGVFATNELPFKKIILHGMISDPHGRKMSKTRGNVIDPQHIIHGATLEQLNKELKKSFDTGYLTKKEFEKALVGQKQLFPQGITECGADALRLTLSSHDFRNSFNSFDWKECVKNRKFGNKILHSCKFINSWCEQIPGHESFFGDPQSFAETWILSRLAFSVHRVNDALNNYNFHHAANSILRFLLEEYCDVFVEASKPVLNGSSKAEAESMCHTLLFCMETFLRLLAPFMPFLSEELYSQLVNKNVHSAAFPASENYSKFRNASVENDFNYLLEVIKSIRRLKLAHKVPKEDLNFLIKTDKMENICHHKTLIKDLAKCASVAVSEEPPSSHYFMEPVDDVTCVYLLMNLENFDFIAYKKELLFKEARLLRKLLSWDHELSSKAYQKKSERYRLQDKRQIDKLRSEADLLKNYLDMIEKWDKKT